MGPVDYETRVRQLEAEGMTRSDAQAVADAEEMRQSASWIIKDRATGAIMGETFSRQNAEALKGPKFEVIPILKHLQSLNQKGS